MIDHARKKKIRVRQYEMNSAAFIVSVTNIFSPLLTSKKNS